MRTRVCETDVLRASDRLSVGPSHPAAACCSGGFATVSRADRRY